MTYVFLSNYNCIFSTVKFNITRLLAGFYTCFKPVKNSKHTNTRHRNNTFTSLCKMFFTIDSQGYVHRRVIGVLKMSSENTSLRNNNSSRHMCKTVGCYESKGLNYTKLVKALSHGTIFLATCNAFLLLRDLNLSHVNLRQMFGVLKIY